MELRSCGNGHFIQAIKGGLVTKVLNVYCGQPTLKFKAVSDINEGFLFDKDDVKAERSCIGVMEEKMVKTEPDVLVCDDASDGDHQRINNLGEDDFDNFTLKQFKEHCKTRKRKHSQGFNSSTKTKIEDSSSLENHREKQQMEADDSDFMETLCSLRTKLSKHMRAKEKKCVKDPIACQEIVLVVESEEFQNSREFLPSSGDSAALVEVKLEVPENDTFDRPDDCSVIKSKEDAEITHEWNLESGLKYKWNQYFDLIPLQMVSASSMDFVLSNSELSSHQSTNFPAIEFDDHKDLDCKDVEFNSIHDNQLDDVTDTSVSPPNVATHKDLDCTDMEFNSDIHDNQLDDDTGTPVSLPNVASHKDLDCTDMEFNSDINDNELDDGTDTLVSPPNVATHKDIHFKDMEFNSDTHDNQLDDDTNTPVSPPNVATQNDFNCTDVEFRDDTIFLGGCSKDEFTAGVEVQAKRCFSIEYGLNPDGCLVFGSNVSPEYEEKKSIASINDVEEGVVNEATEELTSGDEHNGSSKLHGPERLLSTRKAISPSSQEKLCKVMESVDLDRKNNLRCSGKIHFTEQTDKNGNAKGLNDIMRTGSTNKSKISVNPKTSKRGSNPKGISKIPYSSRPATRMGCSTLQSCSKSAIAFSKQQMYDTECIALKLTKELKSMKDIVDDMLRSEFCLNTSLRYKVNEARMAVKNATRAEEGAKRCLSLMARDCNRFCKIMQLADDGSPSPPQDIVRKEKKIAFADEAGGRLCHIRVYENDQVHLPESN